MKRRQHKERFSGFCLGYVRLHDGVFGVFCSQGFHAFSPGSRVGSEPEACQDKHIAKPQFGAFSFSDTFLALGEKHQDQCDKNSRRLRT